MNRKILAALSATLLLAVPARPDDAASKEVRNALDALNKAFEKSDAQTVKGLMTADHVTVTSYYGGPQTRDEQVKNLPHLKYAEYKPGKMQVSMLGKDAALITYPLAQKGTFKGKEMPRKNYASSLWVRRDGKWMERFYQETSLDAK